MLAETNVNLLGRVEPATSGCFAVADFRNSSHFDAETMPAEPLHIIGTVPAPVIMLSEMPGTLFGGENALVFIGRRSLRIDRHLEKRPSSRSEYTQHFIHRPTVIGNVLKNMVAENHVERSGREWQVHDIHETTSQWRIEISRHIMQGRQLDKLSIKAEFRRQMQQSQRLGKQFWMIAAQVEPQQSMTGVRIAARATDILHPPLWSCINREETSRSCTATRAKQSPAGEPQEIAQPVIDFEQTGAFLPKQAFG